MDSEGLSSLFLNSDYTLSTFTFSSHSFSLYSLASTMTDYDLTGQVVWPSALLLSEYLIENSALLKDKKVLELGSGAGLSGYVASFFSKEVLLTDGNDIVVSLLEKNIDFWDKKNISCRQLAWGTIPTQEMLEEIKTNPKTGQKEEKTSFQLIIGADIVFWPGAITPLGETLEVLMGEEECEVLIAGSKRALNVEKEFEEELGRKGMRRDLVREKDGVFLYKIKKN